MERLRVLSMSIRIILGVVVFLLPIQDLSGEDIMEYEFNSLTSLIIDRENVHKKRISVYGKLVIEQETLNQYARLERCEGNLHEYKMGLSEKYFFLGRYGEDLTHFDLIFGPSSDKNSDFVSSEWYSNPQDLISTMEVHNFKNNDCFVLTGIFSKYAHRHMSAALGGFGTLAVEYINGEKIGEKR